MALTLDSTAKGANANAYVDEAGADAVMDGRGFKTDWTSASTVEREVALVWATTIIERYYHMWKGDATEAETQRLSWPRGDVYTPDGRLLDKDTIPEFLKEATAELALILIANNQVEDKGTGLTSFSAGSLSMVFDKQDRKNTIPDSVRAVLRDYGTVREIRNGHMKLVRV